MKSKAEGVDDTEVLGLGVRKDEEAFGGEREKRKRIGIRRIEIWFENTAYLKETNKKIYKTQKINKQRRFPQRKYANTSRIIKCQSYHSIN